MARTAREQIGVDLPDPQTPEAAVAPQQDNSADDGRPGWLPEKFDSPEAFAASYNSLESKLKQDAEERQQLQSRVEELTQAVQSWSPQHQAPQHQDNSVDQTKEQLTAMYENDPIGTMAFLATQYADQRVNQALQQFEEQRAPGQAQQQQAQNQMLAMTVERTMRDRHDDWEDYKPKIAEALQSDPWLLPEAALQAGPEAAAHALERVYQLAKSQDVLAQIEAGTYDASREKQMAQTMSGNGGRGGTVDPVDDKMARLQAATKNMSYSAFRGAT